MQTLLFALLIAFAPPQGAVKASPVKAKAEVSIDAPAEVKVYFPVVLQLKDAASGTQARFKITPSPAYQKPLPPLVEKVTDKDGKESWKVTPKAGVEFGGPPGTYRYAVLYVDFDAKLFGELEGEVTIVGDAPTPQPPPIVPPPVTDPDFQKIKAAYDADTPTDPALKKLNAAVLVRYYRDAASVCNNSQATNVADFFREINTVAKSERVGVGLPGVRNSVVAPAIEAVFPPPTNGANPVVEVQRKALGLVFNKWANLLEAAAK